MLRKSLTLNNYFFFSTNHYCNDLRSNLNERVLFTYDDISFTPKMKTLALMDYSIGVLFNTKAQNIVNENKSAYTRLFFISRKYFFNVCTMNVLPSMDKQSLIEEQKKEITLLLDIIHSKLSI